MLASEKYNIIQTLSLEKRLSARKDINEKTFKGVINSPSYKRSETFFREISDNQEIWTLWDSFGVISFHTETMDTAIGVWPHKKYAEYFAETSLQGKSTDAVPVPLDDFINEIAFSPTANIRLAIFPKSTEESSDILTPDIFATELKSHLTRRDPLTFINRKL